jgi:hypothetical protein
LSIAGETSGYNIFQFYPQVKKEGAVLTAPEGGRSTWSGCENAGSVRRKIDIVESGRMSFEEDGFSICIGCSYDGFPR